MTAAETSAFRRFGSSALDALARMSDGSRRSAARFLFVGGLWRRLQSRSLGRIVANERQLRRGGPSSDFSLTRKALVAPEGGKRIPNSLSRQRKILRHPKDARIAKRGFFDLGL